MTGTAGKRAVSWVFDGTVMLAGALLGAVALVELVGDGVPDVGWAVALLVGAPLAALMSRFPLLLNRSTSAIEVGFDSAVLVFLA